MKTWTLHEGLATEAQILAHLADCDPRFVPPLAERIDLPAYATRLHTKARCYEAWSDGRLVGLVAAYFDEIQGGAFVSNVSVQEAFLGRGIASTLLAHGIAQARAAGLACVRLEVGLANAPARHLYEKHCFRACPGVGEQVLMQLDLPGSMR